MTRYTESVERLIDALMKLPGVGRRSAERMVNYILHAPAAEVAEFSGAINRVKENVGFCRRCHNLSEEELCVICKNAQRDSSTVCVVEKPSDVTAIEKSGNFKGVYHVLMGAISPLDGVGPNELKIPGLVERIRSGTVKEVIIATDADTEGETTALYLTRLLKPLGVRVSRIGVGIPMGSNLEYADAGTLSRSLEARREL